MKILIIDEKKTRREELASINKEVNNILKNCDQLHILTGNECTSFIEEIRSNKETSHIAKYAIICCHHTFVEKIEDQLKKICRKNSIPLIFFSIHKNLLIQFPASVVGEWRNNSNLVD